MLPINTSIVHARGAIPNEVGPTREEEEEEEEEEDEAKPVESLLACDCVTKLSSGTPQFVFKALAARYAQNMFHAHTQTSQVLPLLVPYLSLQVGVAVEHNNIPQCGRQDSSETTVAQLLPAHHRRRTDPFPLQDAGQWLQDVHTVAANTSPGDVCGSYVKLACQRIPCGLRRVNDSASTSLSMQHQTSVHARDSLV